MREPGDLGADVGGVHLPFCAMNAAGTALTSADLRAVVRCGAGAVVMRTATVHPFVHPEFRSLQNPGFDKLVPLAHDLAALGDRPVVASVCGSSPDELALLARAFGEAGVAAVEANLAEPWIDCTLAPFEEASVLAEVARRLGEATTVPIWVRLPDRPLAYASVLAGLAGGGIRAVIVRNEFNQFEKLLLERRDPIDVVAFGNIGSGYDVRRALGRGARAVQVGPTLGPEGPAIFARLEREMRRARDGA